MGVESWKLRRQLEYMTFQRFTLDANHFWVSGIVFVAAGLAAFVHPEVLASFDNSITVEP